MFRKAPYVVYNDLKINAPLGIDIVRYPTDRSKQFQNRNQIYAQQVGVEKHAQEFERRPDQQFSFLHRDKLRWNTRLLKQPTNYTNEAQMYNIPLAKDEYAQLKLEYRDVDRLNQIQPKTETTSSFHVEDLAS